jgi:hypothetical protein
MCESFKMPIKMMCQVQKHFINKSFEQAKQCKWLVKMESILGHGFVLDSLHSHNLDMGDEPPSSL